MKYKRGTNQYRKREKNVLWYIPAYIGVIAIFAIVSLLIKKDVTEKVWAEQTIVSAYVEPTQPVSPTPTPTELEEIVAYIARKFEPEGKDVVVRAINCFYSESGLRTSAVGQNTDSHKSKDWGIAQLNDYYHNLSEKEKTDIRANIDRAYRIYKGRGNSFSAWYGKLCN